MPALDCASGGTTCFYGLLCWEVLGVYLALRCVNGRLGAAVPIRANVVASGSSFNVCDPPGAVPIEVLGPGDTQMLKSGVDKLINDRSEFDGFALNDQ